MTENGESMVNPTSRLGCLCIGVDLSSSEVSIFLSALEGAFFLFRKHLKRWEIWDILAKFIHIHIFHIYIYLRHMKYT